MWRIKSVGKAWIITLGTIAAWITFQVSASASMRESTVFGDPQDYFPGCTCSSVFICFVIWMVGLIIIAMFQWGDGKKRWNISQANFSAIAIGLLFIIFSVPLWIMISMLTPDNFPLNPESGNYEFSKYGEKEAEGKLTGSYTEAERDNYISQSKKYILTSWWSLAGVSGVSMLLIPPYLRKRANEKETDFRTKKKKKKSKGKIGTRKVGKK